MSLADELLADLEEDDDAEEMIIDKTEAVSPATLKPLEEEIKITSIKQLATLRSSERLQRIMNEMQKFQSHPDNAKRSVGPLEIDPEYQLIVEANNLAVDIDNEIILIHRFVRDKYSKRFPELESLVVQPQEYMMTVRELGNDLDKAKNNEALQQFLTQATIMVVSVTASTTQGQMLTDRELVDIQEACDMAAELNSFKLRIYEYVESRMTFIAPNLSAIVGASTAAKVMGVAGGLTKLSKMPACNLLILGSQSKTLSGFSTAAALPHTGFIYYSDIVQDTPPDLRRKASRLVATKCTLAARVDASHEVLDGSIGRQLREEIEKKLDKLMVPVCGIEMEILQWTPRKTSNNQTTVRVIYADMRNIIEKFKNIHDVAFAHCISADFGVDRQMSAGVALSFREQFGRPTEDDCITPHLAFQQAGEGGAGVYSLVTKPKFYTKPLKSVYDQAFNELIEEINKKGYKHLICSPMGCVRDRITIDHFLTKIFYLQLQTGVSISIVTHNEYSRGNLWNGLKYKDFLRKIWTDIGTEYEKREKKTTLEINLQQVPVCGIEMEILQWTPRKTSLNQTKIRIIYADMEDIIEKFRNEKYVAFAHCISADFVKDRQLTAGVTLAFKKKFGRPTEDDCLSEHLAFQQANDGGAGVYSLVTKLKFNRKPQKSDYDQAFNKLINELNEKGYKHLICPPMGCVRDCITIDHFITNILTVQTLTGIDVSIITHNEQTRKKLWNGLSYEDFLRNLWSAIRTEYQKYEQ